MNDKSELIVRQYIKKVCSHSDGDVYGKIEEDGHKLRVVGKTSEGCSFEAELYYFEFSCGNKSYGIAGK